MSLDESNDSRIILPILNGERNNQFRTLKDQSPESLESDKDNKQSEIQFPESEAVMKRSPTNYHLIKIHKPKNWNAKYKISVKNNTPMNNNKNKIKIYNNQKIDIIENEFPLLLKHETPHYNNKINSKFAKNVLNMNDIYRINLINKKIGNKSAIISNKLIVNRLLSVKLTNKVKNIHKKLMLRNRHIFGYSPSSAFISFSKETQKNNEPNINIQPISNSNTNINNSINIIQPKLLNLPLTQEKKNDVQAIFISKLNISSSSNTKRSKRFKKNEYVKKWDLPKSFSFEKVTGRHKEIKNPLKLQYLERFFEYTPKYDSILCNNNKAYVKYNPDSKNDFKQYKINTTRKYLFNRLNIMNNPGNNYNILNILNEHKLKVQQKMDKKKLDKILNEYVDYHKNKKSI